MGILNGLINLQDLKEIGEFEKKNSIITFGKVIKKEEKSLIFLQD